MKLKLFLFFGLAIGLFICFLFIFKSEEYKLLTPEPETTFSFEEEVPDMSYLLIGNHELLEHWFTDETNEIDKFWDQIREWPFKYSEYDYLLTFGKKIRKVEYLESKNRDYDGCPFLEEIPLKIGYETPKYLSQIFLYKISEKGKFRHLCP